MNDAMTGRITPGAHSAETAVETDTRGRDEEGLLDRRLALLESERDRMGTTVRLLGAGLLLALIGLAGALAGFGRTRPAASIVTGEVVLRDASGVIRGLMGTHDDGSTRFFLADGEGRERIRLTVLPDGSPGVTISDADARSRIVLAYLPDGTTSLVFANAQGLSRAVVGLEPDGAAHALFADFGGTVRTVVGVGSDGLPVLSVFDEQ
jgi:hypothetical protein